MKRQHIYDIKQKILDLKIPPGKGYIVRKFRKVGNSTICSVVVIPMRTCEGEEKFVKKGAKWTFEKGAHECVDLDCIETLIGVARKRKGDIYNKDVGEILAMLDLKR